ncbi:MAG TPA: glycosyltransferase [Cytophagaceae bacterium]|jgi:hypothetical protein|nr:glycosyltransferase [Cytophagaceae bacterium]
MGKIYILYYEFKSTAGNHAGMAYLARYLAKNNSQVYLIRHIPQEYKGGKYIGYMYSLLLALYLLLRVRKNDKIFFMEYISGHFAYQENIAKWFKFFNKKNQLLGLVHLSGIHLKEYYKNEEAILSRLLHLDKVVVFGSSLKSFIMQLGFPREIICTFHYVDTMYYKPAAILPVQGELQVVFVGNLKRNFKQLEEIIKGSDGSIRFHICMGKFAQALTLESYSNVSLYGFLEEDDLLKLLQSCHVNLSVLQDTVGSNAITCSLAAGLVQVGSDVGSIRDYCDGQDSFLCKNTSEFIKALETLQKDSMQVVQMRNNAVKKAANFSKENFLNEFEKFWR